MSEDTRNRDADAAGGPRDEPGTARHVVHHVTDGNWAPLVPLLAAQRAAGWRVTTVSVPSPDTELLQAHLIRHVDLAQAVHRRPTGRGVRAGLRLLRVLTDLEPDVLHTHGHGLGGRLAGRVSRSVAAVVHTVEDLDPDDDGGLQLRERLAATGSHVEIVHSQADEQHMVRLGVAPHRLRRVGDGIDLARFDRTRQDLPSRAEVRARLGLEDRSFVIGAAGRLVTGEGWQTLLRAYRDARSKRPGLRLVVVGDRTVDAPGALPGALVGRAEADGALFLDDRSDLDELYPAFDCFVLPSRRGRAVFHAMEAMAMRLPVYAPTGALHREIVEHGRTGELYPPGTHEALAYSLVRAAFDRNRTDALAAGARRKARLEFDLDDVVRQTLETYRDALRLRAADPGSHSSLTMLA